ncbi:hypothetical protein HELRODRAFT_146610, partial [Helobdella robusta]|uniref:Biogenesis of lysosome-related organelles complex 1 subunit 7 n=1 Tax=Helobdella robusta TaxID=6412 RepID=T1EJT4_HELRO
EIFADGLLELFKPAVGQLDERVLAVRQSQMELRHSIETLADDLKKIAELQNSKMELEPYLKKLTNARRRVMLANNILQNAQDRLNRLQTHVNKELAKKKALLD